MTSPWRDLDRPPLRPGALTSALVGANSVWTEVRVLDRTASTNADAVAAAQVGAPEGLVVVAEEQTAGRGRGERTWSAPARSGLTFSVLLRPPVSRERWGWLPLLAGLAVATPLARMSGADIGVKWPNDVLVDGQRKLAGVLAEVAGDAVVLGVGLNVSLRADELPVESATSLVLEGSEVTDRDPVLRAVLRDLSGRYRAWCGAAGDAESSGAARDYRATCVTLGRDVLVSLPDGSTVAGAAVDVDPTGRLVVRTAAGTTALTAGDVHHVR